VRTEDPSPAPFAPLDWALGRKDDYLRRRESGGESKTGPSLDNQLEVRS